MVVSFRNHMKNKLSTFALAVLVAAPLSISHAQPYYVAGAALTPAWAPGAAANQMTGGPTAYSLTTTTATNTYNEFKITGATWDDPNWPSSNAKISGDTNGMNTFYFYPGIFTDGWTPAQNRVGYADPGNMPWEIAGDFTTPNWDSDPNAQMISAGNGLYTNTYVIPTAGTHSFKFRTTGTWGDAQVGSDFGDNPGNATVITTNANQAVLFQLDLPNGRWLAGSVLPPVTNQVVFAVDMTAQIQVGNFNPAAGTVFVSGEFNTWPGTAAGALVLTNFPVYGDGSNTNIYYATSTFIGAPGSSGSQYKFTCNSPAYSGAGGYEPISGNRSFSLLTTSGPLLLPVVKFGNANLSDYLPSTVMVTFTVNMTNAVSYPDGHVFNPASDVVFINGNFLAGGWAAWNPIALNQMVNDPAGSQIYTYTATVAAGSLGQLDYKYGMYYSSATNYDNEAAAYNDHFRYVRTTATGTYTMPQDTFGNQYAEPNFGQLTSASATPGNVAVTWLGRPGIQLQSNSSLSGDTWQTIAGTDGTNWTTGYVSTNGFISQTNWPASGGQQFFRLIQAW